MISFYIDKLFDAVSYSNKEFDKGSELQNVASLT